MIQQQFCRFDPTHGGRRTFLGYLRCLTAGTQGVGLVQTSQSALRYAHLVAHVHILSYHVVCLIMVCVHEQALPAAPTCDLEANVSSSHPSAYMTQLCTPGYYGPVCSLCVRTEQRNSSYGRTGPLKCRVCRHPAITMLAYIASTLVVLAWLSYVIDITLTDNVEAANGTRDPGRASQLIRVYHKVDNDVYATCAAFECHRCLCFLPPLPLLLFRSTSVMNSRYYTSLYNLVQCILYRSMTHPNLAALQAFNLWLQYMSLLGLVNIPTPRTVQVIFNAASLAFTTISSGILSLDCLLTGSVDRAVQGLLIHLALPLLMLVVLSAIQLLR